MQNQDLFFAIMSRNIDRVVEFIHRKGDVNGFLQDDMSPLVFTLYYYWPENAIFDVILLRLIDAGADVNARHPTSAKTATMMIMERQRSDEIVLKFINAGTDVSLVCRRGKTLLIYAIENNCSKTVVSELLNKGADVNKSRELYRTLFYAIFVYKKADILLAEMLFNAGSKMDGDDFTIDPFFGKCCPMSCKIDEKCNNKRLVDILIKKGVDLKATDYNGNTVIHLVTSCNYVISLALKNGVSIETKNNDNMTPLLQSLLSRQTDKFNDLLLMGANPNCVEKHGCTPLHYFKYVCYERLVNLLIFHGADILAKNDDGITPFDIIFSYSNYIYSSRRYESGMKALIKHYLLYVNEHGLNEAVVDIQNNCWRELFQRFIFVCNNELYKMRNSFLKEGLTFYNFCRSKKFYRDNFVPINIHEFKCDYESIRKDFPIFKRIIIIRLEHNSRKNFKHELLRNLECILIRVPFVEGDEWGGISLSYDCLYRISKKYLNFKQLYALFAASFVN